jgi:hypothetical protein
VVSAVKFLSFLEAGRIPPDEWDGLTTHDLYCTRSWLWYVERFGIGRPEYFLSDGAQVAAVSYLLGPETDPSAYHRPDRMLARLTAGSVDELPDLARLAALQEVVLPCLVVGGWRFHDSQVLVEEAADQRRRVELLRDAVRELRTEARQRGARTIAFPYVGSRDGALRSVLRDEGYLCCPSGAAAHLEVRFVDLDGYVSWLPRSHRAGVRKEIRLLHEAGVRTRFEKITDDAAEFLAPYDARASRLHGIDKSLEQSRLSLHGLAGLRQGEAILGLSELDGDVLAFSTAVLYDGTLYVRQFGKLNDDLRLPIYYGLVYYAHVELATQRGVRQIHYGLESENAKRLRGCELVPQHLYVAPTTGELPHWLRNDVSTLVEGSGWPDA